MAVQYIGTPLSHVDDEAFRFWGKAVTDAIVACGITRIAETGCIDWVTAAKPNQGQYAGWEMFAFADALQATAPVMFKVEFGTSLSGTASKSFRITIGCSTNGSGVFNAPVTAALPFFAGNVTGTVLNVGIVSGDTNRILVFCDVMTAAPQNALGFSLERTKNAVGGDTTFGVVLVGLATNPLQVTFSLTMGTIATDNVLCALVPSVGNGSTGVQTSVYPIFPVVGPFLNPILGVLGMFAGNYTAGVPISVTLLGASRRYMPVSGTAYLLAAPGLRTGTLIRYE